MSMKHGIQQWVDGAVDTVEETSLELIAGGIEPEAAVRAAAIMTKKAVAARLEKNLGNQNAASITHALKAQTTPMVH